MRRTMLTIILAMMTPVVGIADTTIDPNDVVVVTTDTVPGKECTVAFNLPAVSWGDIKPVAFDDPTFMTLAKSLEGFQVTAAKMNANSVIGVKVNMWRLDSGFGKVVLTGTLANCE